jgi:membrane-associated protein
MNYTETILQAGITFSYLLIFITIFAESGLFFGFFLPGDSFLLTLGLVASQGHLNLPILLTLCTVAAISGDSVGYATGKRFGPSLFQRPDSRFFKRQHLQRAQDFYQLHGKKTIVLARFTPFVRTFAPILAGAAGMHYPTFLLYNVLGGILWVNSLTLLGYVAGNTVPHIDRYILGIVVAIVVISLIPVIRHLRPKP